jgi:hypothetical protein
VASNLFCLVTLYSIISYYLLCLEWWLMWVRNGKSSREQELTKAMTKNRYCTNIYKPAAGGWFWRLLRMRLLCRKCKMMRLISLDVPLMYKIQKCLHIWCGSGSSKRNEAALAPKSTIRALKLQADFVECFFRLAGYFRRDTWYILPNIR